MPFLPTLIIRHYPPQKLKVQQALNHMGSPPPPRYARYSQACTFPRSSPQIQLDQGRHTPTRSHSIREPRNSPIRRCEKYFSHTKTKTTTEKVNLCKYHFDRCYAFSAPPPPRSQPWARSRAFQPRRALIEMSRWGAPAGCDCDECCR